MARRGARGDPRGARLGTRGQELLRSRRRPSTSRSRAPARCSCARTSTFSFDGFFTGAYRDIPLAQDVSAQRRRGERGRHRLRAAAATRRSAAAMRPASSAPCDCRRACASSGTTSRTAASGRSRLRYRLRGVVIAHDDAVEVAPQVWGRPVEIRAPPAHGQRARGRRAARHARLDRAGLAGPPPDRAPRRGADGRRRRAGAAQRDAARAVSALGARARRSLRRRTCTTTSCRPRSHASRQRPTARSATSASSRTRSTIRGPGSLAAALLGDRPGRRARWHRLLALRSRASDRDGSEVRARAARRPGARARAVAARATSHRRRRPDGGDAVRARPARAVTR